MPRNFALASVVVLGTALAVPSFADGGKPDGGKPDGGKPDGGKHWVATWATSPATFFVYTPPVPPVYPPGAPTTFAPANIQPDLVFPFPMPPPPAPPPTTRPSDRSSSPISGAAPCASASPTPSAASP